MNMQLNAKVGSLFKLQVLDSNGIQKRESDWFQNTVLNYGLNIMATKTWMYGVQVGGGSSTPNAAQTHLDIFHAQSTSKVTESFATGVTDDGLYGWKSRINTYRFAAGAFNSTVLTEIGQVTEVVESGSGVNAVNRLWNRTLIKNALGDPISITVENDEILDVTVESRFYFELSDKTGAFNVLNRDGGIEKTVNFIMRPAQSDKVNTSLMYGLNVSTWDTIAGYTGIIRDITASSPSGSALFTSYNTSTGKYLSMAYVDQSLKVSKILTLPITVGNGLMASMLINTMLGIWQVQFEPPILKTADESMELRLEYTWGSWS